MHKPKKASGPCKSPPLTVELRSRQTFQTLTLGEVMSGIKSSAMRQMRQRIPDLYAAHSFVELADILERFRHLLKSQAVTSDVQR